MTLQSTPTTADIGRMRTRIRIQWNRGAQSASGTQLTEWVDLPDTLGMVWAEKNEVNGNELFGSRELYPELMTTFSIRFHRLIDSMKTASYRVFWLDPYTKKDRQYDVLSATTDQTRRFTQLNCKERPIERAA